LRHCLRQLARSRGLSGLQLGLERLLKGRVLAQDALLGRVDLDRQRCDSKRADFCLSVAEAQRCNPKGPARPESKREALARHALQRS
jgi:hypothetical protein